MPQPLALLKQLPKFIVLSAVCIAGLTACDKNPSPPATTQAAPTEKKQQPTSDIDIIAAGSALWQAQSGNVASNLTTVLELEQSVKRLLDSPTSETLLAAQQAWTQAEINIAKLALLFRLNEHIPSLLSLPYSLKFRIAANPIQPGYLDKFGPYPFSGLVFDIGVAIDENSLNHQHGLTDKEEIVLGLYAIEFMLFGESGLRPADDYLVVSQLSQAHSQTGLEHVSEIPNNRRRAILEQQVQLLRKDFTTLANTLKNNTNEAPTARWLKLPAAQQINAVRKAVDTVLTQALIDISNVQTLSAEINTNSDIPKIETDQAEGSSITTTNDVHANKLAVERITGAIQTSLNAKLYYSAIERKALEQAIAQASQQLQAVTLDPTNADATSQTLQTVYEQLRQLQ